jgi:hypothetical protein
VKTANPGLEPETLLLQGGRVTAKPVQRKVVLRVGYDMISRLQEQ